MSQRSRSADTEEDGGQTEDGERKTENGKAERGEREDRGLAAKKRKRRRSRRSRILSQKSRNADTEEAGDGPVRWAVRSARGLLCETRFGSR